MGDDTNFLSEHWPTLAALAKGTTTCHFEEKGVCVCASVCESLSHIRLFVTPWTWGCKPWSLLGSSVHEILQARILERVAISFSRGSSQPRDRTRVSCIAGEFFTTEPPGKLSLPVAIAKEWRKVFQELKLGSFVPCVVDLTWETFKCVPQL